MRPPVYCRECGTPEDEVPFVECKAHAAAHPGCVLCYVHGYPCSHCVADALNAAAHPPELTMDERDFAPPEALAALMASTPPWGDGAPIGPNPEFPA